MAAATLVSARLAERAERYDEMRELMQSAVESGAAVDADVRSLLGVAFKEAIGRKRAAWRILGEIERKEREKGMSHGADCCGEYRAKVAAQIVAAAEDGVRIGDRLVERAGMEQVGRAFALKFKADHMRYAAEAAADPERRRAAAADCAALYDEALRCGLAPDDPLQLSTTLNKAVFLYEIAAQPDAAIALLESAAAALPHAGHSNGPGASQKTVIATLIEDNLRLWKMGPRN